MCEAIAIYFADMDHADDRAASSRPGGRARDVLRAARHRTGDRSRCASLHGRLRLVPLQLRAAPLAVRPDLALNSALNLPDPGEFHPSRAAMASTPRTAFRASSCRASGTR